MYTDRHTDTRMDTMANRKRSFQYTTENICFVAGIKKCRVEGTELSGLISFPLSSISFHYPGQYRVDSAIFGALPFF